MAAAPDTLARRTLLALPLGAAACGADAASLHDALVEEHAAGDAGDLQRRWLVTVRREPEGWRVTNREELADQ